MKRLLWALVGVGVFAGGLFVASFGSYFIDLGTSWLILLCCVLMVASIALAIFGRRRVLRWLGALLLLAASTSFGVNAFFSYGGLL